MMTPAHNRAFPRDTDEPTSPRREHSYSVAIPAEALDDQGTLIDALISFAFDNLDARHFNLRVYDRS